METVKKKGRSGTMFAFASREKDDNGKELFSRERIKFAIMDLSAEGIVESWAYIKHDKDTKTMEGEEWCGEDIGSAKAPHWHVVINFNRPVYLPKVAKMFHLPEHMIQVCKNTEKARIGLYRYLIHGNKNDVRLGKHQYDPSEVAASFDYAKALDKWMSKDELLAIDAYVERVYKGMPIEQVGNEMGYWFVNKYKTRLNIAEQDYIRTQKSPSVRVNYYISGPAGSGKTSIAVALARSLFPDLSEYECYCFAGSKGSVFANYSHQPVIIWDDTRAQTLLDKCGGRENTFVLFDSHPHNIAQNVKYGHKFINNSVNIVCSVQEYPEFLSVLAGNEDRNQATRRFPMIINVRLEDMDFLFNEGWLDETTYETYKADLQLRMGIREINRRMKNLQTILLAEGKSADEVRNLIAAKRDEEMKGLVEFPANKGQRLLQELPIEDVEPTLFDELKDTP